MPILGPTMKRLLLTASIALICSSCAAEPPRGYIDPVMERFGEVEEELREIVESDGIREAIDHLNEVIEDEPELADLCHGLAHVIGESAFEHVGYEAALQYENDTCGSGYIHGVVESYLAGVEDIEKEILTLCPPNAPKCFHGIGHGLMDRSSNDLPGSLALCGKLPERKNKIQCAEGVFMENVEADFVVHPTDYLRADDPFFPCRGQTKINEGVCAFYAPRYFLRLHPRAYTDALAWCETLDEGPKDACVKGVGDVAVKQNITTPLTVQGICDAAVPERRHYCIEGLVSYYIVHYASAGKGRELCPQLEEEHRSACEKIVRESEPFYPN